MPEVPEYFVRDMPLAVPLHGILVFEPRLMRIILLELIAFGKLQILDLLLHLEYRIDRAFFRSRHVPDTYDDPLEVLVIYRLVLDPLFDLSLVQKAGRDCPLDRGHRNFL